MAIDQRLIFLHGLFGTSQGVKASLLRGIFPAILTPDLSGSLEERIQQLYEVVNDDSGWTVIGSSFGGLMAALFARQRPSQVERLVLLAPALTWPDFAASPQVIDTPTVVYHGTRDEIIRLVELRPIAERAFRWLRFQEVDDDHGLFKTVHEIDWKGLLSWLAEGR